MAPAVEQVEETSNRIRPDAAAELHFLFGMVHLRHGETQNCCLLHNKDSCLLPIRGGGIHTRQGRSSCRDCRVREGRGHCAKGLRALSGSDLVVEPGGDEPGRISRGRAGRASHGAGRFLSREKFPRFMNIAGDLGLDTNSLCGSVVAEDFNNDGYLDLMVSTWDVREPLKFYLNNGAGKFDRPHQCRRARRHRRRPQHGAGRLQQRRSDRRVHPPRSMAVRRR